MVVGSGLQHGGKHGLAHDDVPVEKGHAAAASEAGRGAGADSVEQKSSMAWALLGKEMAALFGHFGAMRQRLHAPDVGPAVRPGGRGQSQRPQRGLAQRLKLGVSSALGIPRSDAAGQGSQRRGWLLDST